MSHPEVDEVEDKLLRLATTYSQRYEDLQLGYNIILHMGFNVPENILENLETMCKICKATGRALINREWPVNGDPGVLQNLCMQLKPQFEHIEHSSSRVFEVEYQHVETYEDILNYLLARRSPGSFVSLTRNNHNKKYVVGNKEVYEVINLYPVREGLFGFDTLVECTQGIYFPLCKNSIMAYLPVNLTFMLNS